MGDEEDLEQEVERQTRAAMAARSRFASWPTWQRGAVVLAAVAVMVLPACALVWTLHRTDPGFPWWAAALCCAVPTVVLVVAGVRHARDPEGATRRTVRRSMRVPRSSPGYATWKGDEGRRPRSGG